MTRLHQLRGAGQSIWLDYIDRAILQNGELERRIRDDALTGMTSNPTIFEKALAEGTAYDEQLAAASPDLTGWQLFELIETEDVRSACDIFRPTYDRTNGGDGYVSIEVSPGAAHDAEATIAEAHRLWETVGRPNVMVKVPGTAQGAIAVRRLIADGLNINITLLFSIDAYRSVIEAYMSGLEDRLNEGKPIDRAASVASFFVSRVDTAVDQLIAATDASSDEHNDLAKLQGRAAIANAQLAYGLFLQTTSRQRWLELAERGARVQRPLWASTSTKNPEYRDVMYVEQLIGPDTVNTMPPATLDAFRDHGIVARTVDADFESARAVIAALQKNGISMEQVTQKLLVEGIASFEKSFHGLVAKLSEKATTNTSSQLTGHR
ncbi:MAG: transaldolase [Gemmatimonadaceae bacterium]